MIVSSSESAYSRPTQTICVDQTNSGRKLDSFVLEVFKSSLTNRRKLKYFERLSLSLSLSGSETLYQ